MSLSFAFIWINDPKGPYIEGLVLRVEAEGESLEVASQTGSTGKLLEFSKGQICSVALGPDTHLSTHTHTRKQTINPKSLDTEKDICGYNQVKGKKQEIGDFCRSHESLNVTS